MSDYSGVWADPPIEEEQGPYPKLRVSDSHMTGSITVVGSRLPLWAFVPLTIAEGWDAAEHGWEPGKAYDYHSADAVGFIDCLLEQRGEFGRLLTELAAAEHRANSRVLAVWWEAKRSRARVRRQLRRCIEVLDEIEAQA